VDRLIAIVGLRFRLEARATLGSRGRTLGLLLALPALALFSLFSAILAFATVRVVERAQPGLLVPGISALATLAAFVFVLSPLLAGIAATETHDLTRLLSYPVRLRTMLLASLVANLVQPTVLALLPPLAALAWALGGPRAAPAFAALGLGLLLVLAVAQAVGVALHALSRNRRAHDRLLFAGIGFGVLLSLLPVLLLARGGSAARRLAGAFLERDVFVLSPFAWSARAAVHAGRGEWLAALGFSGGVVVALLSALALSAVIAERLYRGEVDSGSAAGARARARVLLPGAVGALVEKDLRTAWRDPRLKAVTLSGVIGPLLLLFLLGQGSPSGVGPAQLGLVACLAGLSVIGSNALALERDGIGLLLGFPVDRLALVAGKSLAVVVLRAPALVALSLAALVIAGPVVALAVATVVLLTQVLGSAADSYLQILAPIAVPAAGRDPSAPVSGSRGLGAAALGLVAMTGTLALAAPFAFLAWLPQLVGRPWLHAVSLPLALAGACAVYFMAASGASRLLVRREPELVARLRGEE
jgi:ABC-2 type transport system permease protein